MTNPRIRYDIQANAEGEQDVARLTRELEKLDAAVDPQAAAEAKRLGEALQELGNKRTAVDAFSRALVDASEAGRKLEETTTAVQRLERALEGVAAPTRTQAGQLQKLRDAASQAQTAFQAKNQTLNAARTALDRYGVSASSLDGAEERLTASIRTTAAEAQKLVTSYQQTATAAGTATRAQDQLKTQLQGIGEQLRNVQALAGGLLGGSLLGGAAGDISRTADEFANLSAKIRLVTGDGAGFQSALEGVQEIALRTNTDLDSTATLFARLAEAGKELGVSQQAALALTETINQSIQLSGGTVESNKAAITQLIQGLQSGVLRGEEFNSVVEQTPRLAKALADGLGVARGELRELANQGRLTADVVIQALQGQAATVQAEFSKLPPTVGRALQNLSTAWTVYIGQTDQASGASLTAAKAIDALSKNLKTIADLLLDVGQAGAAFAALRLAQNFLGLGTATAQAAAAKQAETIATAQNTAAQLANTAATTANAASKTASAVASARAAAAAEASAASAGRLAAAFSTIKTFTLVGIVSNLQDIGTWAGEAAARLLGYGKAAERAEAQIRADAEAARENAAQKAALADAARKAAEATLGLSKEAKALVGEFDDLIRKGESTAEALVKVSKSLSLGDIKGITDAGAALDALALKGKITGEQVRDALAAGLKGEDLQIFRTNALAAFDSTEQGARRLAAALDAITTQSLARAGTSARELATGFSSAANSAINDVDELDKALRKLGANATDTGRLLTASLDKALSSANTEKAVQAVIDRIVTLGKEGRIAGDALEAGLEKARAKLDELKPGINSLSEAYKVFGITGKAELQRVANESSRAWQLIRSDATLSLSQKQTAFKKYAEDAIAANGGVVTSSLRAEAQTVKVGISADAAGKVIVGAMKDASDAVDRVRKDAREATKEFDTMGNELNTLAAGIRGNAGGKPQGETVGDVNGKVNNKSRPDNPLIDAGGGQARPPDDSGEWEFVQDPRYSGGPNTQADIYAAGINGRPVPRGSVTGVGYWRRKGGGTGLIGRTPSRATLGGSDADGAGGLIGPRTAPAPEPGATSPGAQPIVVNIGGQRFDLTLSDRAKADAFVRALEQAYQQTGGP
jgi:tape measure domain-containing protein